MLAPVIEPADLKKYSGMQRAGALMLALGEKHGAPIWAQLSIDEVTELSSCIAELGRVPAAVVEHLLVQFSSEVAGMATLHGSYDSTERLLRAVMSEEKVREIMENIRGPSGRTMWDKLSNVSETLLATYLKNEYPQTVAVILDKVRPDHAARVLAELPQELSADVIMRMIRIAATGTVRRKPLAGLGKSIVTRDRAPFPRYGRVGRRAPVAILLNRC
jgi:flagellar motor switch protein FliG